jgi:hypothetical protein
MACVSTAGTHVRGTQAYEINSPHNPCRLDVPGATQLEITSYPTKGARSDLLSQMSRVRMGSSLTIMGCEVCKQVEKYTCVWCTAAAWHTPVQHAETNRTDRVDGLASGGPMEQGAGTRWWQNKQNCIWLCPLACSGINREERG